MRASTMARKGVKSAPAGLPPQEEINLEPIFTEVQSS
jgi:hypothetical protein